MCRVFSIFVSFLFLIIFSFMRCRCSGILFDPVLNNQEQILISISQVFGTTAQLFHAMVLKLPVKARADKNTKFFVGKSFFFFFTLSENESWTESISEKKWKLDCINHKGKSILSHQEKRQGLWFKVSSKKLSPEIDILIQSPIPTLTKLDNT